MCIKSNILKSSKNGNICHEVTYQQHACQISRQSLHFWLYNGKKARECNDVTFETQFLVFLFVIRKNKWYFCNRETKLDKIGMFIFKKIWNKKWAYFDRVWPGPFLRPNLKMNVIIEFCVPHHLKNMCCTTLMQQQHVQQQKQQQQHVHFWWPWWKKTKLYKLEQWAFNHKEILGQPRAGWPLDNHIPITETP